MLCVQSATPTPLGTGPLNLEDCMDLQQLEQLCNQLISQPSDELEETLEEGGDPTPTPSLSTGTSTCHGSPPYSPADPCPCCYPTPVAIPATPSHGPIYRGSCGPFCSHPACSGGPYSQSAFFPPEPAVCPYPGCTYNHAEGPSPYSMGHPLSSHPFSAHAAAHPYSYHAGRHPGHGYHGHPDMRAPHAYPWAGPVGRRHSLPVGMPAASMSSMSVTKVPSNPTGPIYGASLSSALGNAVMATSGKNANSGGIMKPGRKSTHYMCGSCFQVGHNRRTCPNIPCTPSKMKGEKTNKGSRRQSTSSVDVISCQSDSRDIKMDMDNPMVKAELADSP